MDPIILEKNLVVRTSSGKVWKLEMDTRIVTLYANEVNYGTDTAVGTMDLSEFTEVYGFLKDWPTS